MRFTLEAFREGNWTFFGVPTAQIVSTLFILGALVILFWRHRSGAPLDDPATFPADQTWGAIGRPVDPDELDDDDDDDDDDDYDDEEEADVEDGDEDDGDADGPDDEEPDDDGGDEFGTDRVEDHDLDDDGDPAEDDPAEDRPSSPPATNEGPGSAVT